MATFFQSLELLAVALPLAAAAVDPASVVVIANRRVPESEQLARHYMQGRNIPESNLCLLDLTRDEQMGRLMYEDQLRDPLLAFLRERGLIEQTKRDPRSVGAHETGWNTVKSSVRYVVSVYGVPLRIADTRTFLMRRLAQALRGAPGTDAAAVDSELALLLQTPYDIRGRVGNALYNQHRWEDLGSQAAQVLVAARLDGPDPASVRRMIDDALTAERYGLHGRAYFDSRSLRRDDYYVGDYWIREACERFRREGYECVLDQEDQVWGERYPMEDAAVYMGWYTDHVVGPFRRGEFRFRSGAFAYHNHSANAATLRSKSSFWAGPLIDRGATATMGAVYEPYLAFSPNLQIFADRLCSGYTFGESAYMAISALSWQITVVGDPLYCPFRHSLEEQIQQLEKDGRAEVEWAYVRRINVLVREGRLNVALAYARERIQTTDSLVLRERLGDLYGLNQLYDLAGEQYAAVLEKAKTAETALRVGTRYLYMLRLLKKEKQAAEVEQQLRERWPGSVVVEALDGGSIRP